MASVTDTNYPSGRKEVSFPVQVTRSMSSNAQTGVVLPAGFVTTGVRIFGTVASNAGTNATVSVGSHNGTSRDWVSAFDVKTLGANLSVPSTVALAGVALPADTFVTAIYSEAGSASTSGGPWVVSIQGLL